MKHAEAPVRSAPGASLRSHIVNRQVLPSEATVSRRQADLGAEEPSISDELLSAWRTDARCAECGGTVAAACDAALLVGPNRVVHRDRCFVPALLRANPLLKLLAARTPAQEVKNVPSVPPGSVDPMRPEQRAGGGHDG